MRLCLYMHWNPFPDKKKSSVCLSISYTLPYTDSINYRFTGNVNIHNSFSISFLTTALVSLPVVYFDQRTGASRAVRWLKSSFSAIKFNSQWCSANQTYANPAE